MKRSQFQFANPELTKVEFEINEDFEPNSDITSNLVTKTDIKRSEKTPEAYVTLSIISSKENNLPFVFDITMGVEVSWGKECEETFINTILKNNVPALLLSYIRPIISILTSNTGYPAFNIPFLDFRNADKESK